MDQINFEFDKRSEWQKSQKIIFVKGLLNTKLTFMNMQKQYFIKNGKECWVDKNYSKDADPNLTLEWHWMRSGMKISKKKEMSYAAACYICK